MSSSDKEKMFNNSLTDLALGVKTASLLTGGSQLASYEGVAYNNNYSLLTLNRVVLTYFYTSSGIIQRAIGVPIQDALSRGVEIESGEMSADEIDLLLDHMERTDHWTKLEDAITWKRLYGGAALIINTNQDYSKPLNPRDLYGQPLEFLDVDRWQIDNSRPYGNDLESELFYDDQGEFVHLYGLKIHKSRVLFMRGKRGPYYVRRQLRGWGMSECERMIPPLNLFMKTNNVLYEILDESKVDIYKISGFNDKLLSRGNTEKITQRIQIANELKNYLQALVMDVKDEYEQKTMSFAGHADISAENRIGIAAAINMPVTKLFGLSASGFNTGESDLETYNQMVEAEIRRPAKPIIRKMIELNMMKLFGYIPSFQIKFPTLRILTAEQEERVKDAKFQRATAAYDRGLMDSREWGEQMRADNIFTVETKAEEGLLPPQPSAPAGSESVAPLGYSPGLQKENSLTFSGHKLQGRDKFQGMEISIENKVGSIREGVNADGTPWKTKFKYPYGYIRGSVGKDGDHVDCYLGPEREAEQAFIIRQNVPETGKFDEDKVMLGFPSAEAAKKAYEEHYDKPGFFGGMKAVSIDKLKNLLQRRKGKKL